MNYKKQLFLTSLCITTIHLPTDASLFPNQTATSGTNPSAKSTPFGSFHTVPANLSAKSTPSGSFRKDEANKISRPNTPDILKKQESELERERRKLSEEFKELTADNEDLLEQEISQGRNTPNVQAEAQRLKAQRASLERKSQELHERQMRLEKEKASAHKKIYGM